MITISINHLVEGRISILLYLHLHRRAFTKTLGVQFGDVAKMMLDKKFKRG